MCVFSPLFRYTNSWTQLVLPRCPGVNGGTLKAGHGCRRRYFRTSPIHRELLPARNTPLAVQKISTQPKRGFSYEIPGCGTHQPSPLPDLAIAVVNNETSLKDMLDEMLDLPAKPPSLYIDAEGENLGRKGTLALLQIMVLPRRCIYVVDIHVLKTAAFTTCARDANTTLKSILESEQIPKVIFDARNDSDNLYNEYGISLGGVRDLQLMEYFSRPRIAGFTVQGLAKCIEQHLHASPDVLQKWMVQKENGKKLYRPKFGRSTKAFFDRPLSSDVLAYAAGDVEHLSTLYRKYHRNLPRHRWKWMLEKSRDRARTAHLPTFALEHDSRWAAPKWTGKWDQGDEAPVEGRPQDVLKPAAALPATNPTCSDKFRHK